MRGGRAAVRSTPLAVRSTPWRCGARPDQGGARPVVRASGKLLVHVIVCSGNEGAAMVVMFPNEFLCCVIKWCGGWCR